MPELPEVETVMRGLTPHLQGQIIQSVTTNRKDLRIPFPKDLKKQLEGKTVIHLKRRAKYILITLEDSNVMIVHLGMSGRVEIIEKKEHYSKDKHDHLILELQNGTKIVYNDPRRFGMIFTVPEEGLEQHKSFSSLGPEPLGNQFSAAYLKEKLSGKTQSIKQAIMDQRIVVGVGNIYACEALYKAGIHSEKKAHQVSLKKLEALVVAIRQVLKKAIDAGGSTLNDYRQADGSLGYFQHQFTVYDREGELCRSCKKDGYKQPCIQRIVQSGRSTYYCSRKQKK
ncbi:MAG: bifunctional DNA-formamidopyrimidine glycosylase/DNA-(apurinic or apyrimidinic site) lyase [Pseudomonadota bacterium]